MSCCRRGKTIETAGSREKSVGKSVNGRLAEAGTFVKLVHGLCLRAYAPLVQPV